MRFDVKKYLFLGLEIEREAFFKKAQLAGMIHFIDQRNLKLKEFPDELSDMKQAIRILNAHPLVEQKQPDENDAEVLVARIIRHKDTIDQLHEEKRILNLEISRVQPLGDFSMSDIAFIEKEGRREVQFFFAKQGSYLLSDLPAEMIYINRSHELDYFIAISPQKIANENFIEMRVEKSIRELKERLLEISRELEIEEVSLKSHVKYNEWLHQVLVNKFNHYHLKLTQESAQTKADDAIFVIEGWVPSNKIAELENLALENHLYVEEIAVEQTDQIPTYLENEGMHKMGEDVVDIYDTPSHADKDPSLWVLLSFAFFFAFIVGDAGYGLVFLLTALYLRVKFPDLQGLKKRMLKLFAVLSVSCIIWGSFTASFFGISFEPNSAVRQFSLIHWLVKEKTAYHMVSKDKTYQFWINKFPELTQADGPEQFIEKAVSLTNGKPTYELLNKFSDAILLELSLLVGVIHLIISMLRYIGRNPVNSGWIFVIIGATLYIPYYLGATSLLEFVFHFDQAKAAHVGLNLIYGGMALSVGISLIKNKLLGLLEVMTAIQIFSDVLSYLRLYALALAGAIVTSVINDAVALMPFILGVVFLLLAHAINIVLAIQGGVIHGLRLNFLEWYHYSFEGGGKKFRPLKLLQTE